MELRHLRYFPRRRRAPLAAPRQPAHRAAAAVPADPAPRAGTGRHPADPHHPQRRTHPCGSAFHARAVQILDAVDDADDKPGGSLRRHRRPPVHRMRRLGHLLTAAQAGAGTGRRAARSRGQRARQMLAPAQLAALAAGDIDLALLRRRCATTTSSPRRSAATGCWWHCRSACPLAGHRTIAVEDLRDADFISHAGRGRSVMSSIVFAACADAGFVPRVRHEVMETSTLVTLVAAGLGGARARTDRRARHRRSALSAADTDEPGRRPGRGPHARRSARRADRQRAAGAAPADSPAADSRLGWFPVRCRADRQPERDIDDPAGRDLLAHALESRVDLTVDPHRPPRPCHRDRPPRPPATGSTC